MENGTFIVNKILNFRSVILFFATPIVPPFYNESQQCHKNPNGQSNVSTKGASTVAFR